MQLESTKYVWLLREIEEKNPNQRLFQKPLNIYDQKRTELNLKFIKENFNQKT